MTVLIQGNFITLTIPKDEGQPEAFQLPNGYSYEKIHILVKENINFIIPYMQVSENTLIFPPVNSKSPCILHPIIGDPTKRAELKILIEKFGQIPDVNYFNKAFDPILVTGDNGDKYKMIPSDQFK